MGPERGGVLGEVAASPSPPASRSEGVLSALPPPPPTPPNPPPPDVARSSSGSVAIGYVFPVL